ncbi:hypothetical protein SeLEV6574_g00126 [Synchytrium endobioticum]|uniref:RCC1-like domain-containing protein n=1 Tax=Synchytrium endobioticum TaxID=286115 RepID=A0A507DLJ1_9FUNG|nr:hypothetical protein SeLEV6574_g00126 [Synchytrium endobioticum]
MPPKRTSKRKVATDEDHQRDLSASPSRRAKIQKVYCLIPSTVGQVFIVGNNDCGQLGLGPDAAERRKPALIKYFNDKLPVQVEAGGLHNMVLTADGKLHSWGCNDQFALGRTSQSDGPNFESIPAPVALPDHIIIAKVACGDSSTAALTQDGFVYSWGTFRNATGIFGLTPEKEVQETPLLLDGLKKVVDIVAGFNHFIAITDDRKLWSWGIGEQGQLARKIQQRHTVMSSLTPRSITFKAPHATDKTFFGAFAGAYHSVFIPNTGSACSVGWNNWGQLGNGMRNDREAQDSPQEVLNVGKLVGGAAGEHHSLFLDNQGRVWACGRNETHQLGYDTPVTDEQGHIIDPDNVEQSCSTKPHLVQFPFNPFLQPPPRVVSVSANNEFSLAVTDEPQNNIFFWGDGQSHQLCNQQEDDDDDDGISDGKDEPFPFRPNLKGRKVIQASAGGQHTVLLLAPKAMG